MRSDSRWSADMPAVYDAQLGPVLFAPFAAVLAERAAAAPTPPRTVLELAAGTGILTRALRDRLTGPPEITATDLNPAMVELGARAVPGARWRQADAMALPFADGAFDLVACAFGAMFLPDRPAAYAEAGRVTAPGGRLLYTVWDRVERNGLTAAFLRALAAVLPDDTPDFVTRVPHGYADPERIRADLATAGLGRHRVESVTTDSCAPSARALAEGFCLGTPLRFALQERGEPAGLADAIATRLAAELGPGPVTGPLTALVVEVDV